MFAKIIIDGTEYAAQYDDAHASLFGFDSDSAFYNVYVQSERAIERAVFCAVEADYSTGVNKNITVTLFPVAA